MINRDILGYPKDKGIEKGRRVRTDCTCVESNIHPPRDDSRTAVTAAVLNVPLDTDPFSVIRICDQVRVDGDWGGLR